MKERQKCTAIMQRCCCINAYSHQLQEEIKILQKSYEEATHHQYTEPPIFSKSYFIEENRDEILINNITNDDQALESGKERVRIEVKIFYQDNNEI